MRLQAQSKQPLLQRHVGGEIGHLAAMHNPAIVHHQHGVADFARDMEVLLDQQDGGAAAF